MLEHGAATSGTLIIAGGHEDKKGDKLILWTFAERVAKKGWETRRREGNG